MYITVSIPTEPEEPPKPKRDFTKFREAIDVAEEYERQRELRRKRMDEVKMTCRGCGVTFNRWVKHPEGDFVPAKVCQKCLDKYKEFQKMMRKEKKSN